MISKGHADLKALAQSLMKNNLKMEVLSRWQSPFIGSCYNIRASHLRIIAESDYL